MTTPKAKPIKIGWNIDPVSIAAGNLSKSLERFTWISIDMRKGWVEEMKEMPSLTHMNMPVLASTLAIYHSSPVVLPLEPGSEQDKSNDLFSFFAEVTARIPPTYSKNMAGLDFSSQDLYDETTRPLMENMNMAEFSSEQINDILLKIKATLFRYSVKLYEFRTDVE